MIWMIPNEQGNMTWLPSDLVFVEADVKLKDETGNTTTEGIKRV
jgi:hypothetical protein